ncbi:hypothetical protein ACFL3D_01845 [Candidatus Omnitrophota bacterium]
MGIWTRYSKIAFVIIGMLLIGSISEAAYKINTRTGKWDYYESVTTAHFGDLSGSGAESANDNDILVYDAATKSWEPEVNSAGAGGSFSGFDIDADTGTAEDITNGDTIMIAGGTNINTAVAATDTVTVNLEDSITVSGFAMSTSPTEGYAMISDSNGNGTWQYIGSSELSPSGVETINGTPTVDTLALVQEYDDDPYIITEGGGADPLDVVLTFSGVTEITEIFTRVYYVGSSSHHILIQLWDYDDGAWEDYFDFVGQEGYTFLTIPVFDYADHVSGGITQLRFHHIQNGITSHILNIDYASLHYGDFVGGSTNLGGYAKYAFGYNDFEGNGDFATEGDITTSGSMTASNGIFGLIGTATQGTIDHDSLANFEANEHFTEASIDHGSIADLEDDDHTQYPLQDGSEENDFTGDVDIVGNLSVSQDVSIDEVLHFPARGNTDAFQIKLIDSTEDGLAFQDNAGLTYIFMDEGGQTAIGDGNEFAYAPLQVGTNLLVFGKNANPAYFEFWADKGDNNNDKVRFYMADYDDFHLQQNIDGTYTSGLKMDKLNASIMIPFDLTLEGNLTVSNEGITFQDSTNQTTAVDGSLYPLIDGSLANEFTGNVDVQGSLSASDNLSIVGIAYFNGPTPGTNTVSPAIYVEDSTGDVNDWYWANYDSSTSNNDGYGLYDSTGAHRIWISEAGKVLFGNVDYSKAVGTVPSVNMENTMNIYGSAGKNAQIAMYGAEGEEAYIDLLGDEADENSDRFRLLQQNSDSTLFQVFDSAGGAYANAIEIEHYNQTALQVNVPYGLNAGDNVTIGGNLSVSAIGITFADETTQTTAGLTDTELDDFSELQAQISDKTLINEEDVVNFDSEVSISANLSVNADIYCKDLYTAGTTVNIGTLAVSDNAGALEIGGDPVVLDSDIDYAFITSNDGATDVTAAELETLTDGSETELHSHPGGAGGAFTETDGVIQSNSAVTDDLSLGGNLSVDKWLYLNNNVNTLYLGAYTGRSGAGLGNIGTPAESSADIQFHDGWDTDNIGHFMFIAGESAGVNIDLWADEGDDAADKSAIYNDGSNTYIRLNNDAINALYFANTTGDATFAGMINMADEKCIGISQYAGHLQWDNQTIDEAEFNNVRVGINDDTPTERLTVGGDGSFTEDLSVNGILYAGPVGYIQGLELSYTSTTTIEISAGMVQCKDKFFINHADEADTISNFSSDAFTYNYVDYSASTTDNIVFIDATTEPTWSDKYQGWYNGDDRCIGALYCDGAATIEYFIVNDSDCFTVDNQITLANGMNPDGTWQTLGTAQSSTYTPVNAIAVKVGILCADNNAPCLGAAVNAEYADNAAGFTPAGTSALYAYAYSFGGTKGYVKLGPSRDIRIGGSDNDDNSLDCYWGGYQIRR